MKILKKKRKATKIKNYGPVDNKSELSRKIRDPIDLGIYDTS